MNPPGSSPGHPWVVVVVSEVAAAVEAAAPACRPGSAAQPQACRGGRSCVSSFGAGAFDSTSLQKPCQALRDFLLRFQTENTGYMFTGLLATLGECSPEVTGFSYGTSPKTLLLKQWQPLPSRQRVPGQPQKATKVTLPYILHLLV